AAIVEACVLLFELGCGDGDELVRRARLELEKAIRLDEGAPEVQLAAATVALRVDWSPAAAEAVLRRVLAARPRNAAAAVSLAESLVSTNAGGAGRIAKNVSRSGCCSTGLLVRAARVLYFAQRYDDALEVFGDAVRRAPDAAVSRLELAAACAKRGDVERAVDECNRALDTHVGRAVMVAAAGNAARACGDRARYDACWRALRRLHQQAPVPACAFALIETS